MIYKLNIKIFLCILSIFFVIGFLPNSNADYPDEYPPNSISEYMIDESTIMTVVNETDLEVEFSILYRNPYDEYKNLTCRFDIPWIFSHGNCKLFGVNGSQWFDVPKNTSHVIYWKNASAYESFITILKGTHYNAVDEADGSYFISQEFLGFDFPSHKVELRIPKIIGQTKVKILDINPITPFLFEGPNFFVIQWKWEGTTIPYNQTSALFNVVYKYEPLNFFETPLGIFLMHPWFLVIISWLLGVISTAIFFNRKKKKRKNNEQKGNGNAFEKILKYFSNAWFLISAFIITIGLVFLIIGAIVFGIRGNEVSLTGASILITLGIGGLSLGFAFLSIGIAKESDRKMNAIAYATFDEAIREIEDRRLTLQARLPILENKVSRRKINIPGDKSELIDAIDEFAIFFQYSIWKCKTYLDRAMNFKEYFRSNPNDREQIIHQIDCLFFVLGSIKKALNHTLHESYKGHIQSMYNTIIEFDEFNKDEIRKNRIEKNRSYLKDEGETTYQIPNWKS